jgi:hypothetical protein
MHMLLLLMSFFALSHRKEVKIVKLDFDELLHSHV